MRLTSCPAEEIRISAIAERDSILVKVRDTGPGINPEIRDRLFQPLSTAGKSDGLGLGLAFSRQAVLDHGGQIWVETDGPGACFALYLPKHRARYDTVSAGSRVPGLAKLRPKQPEPEEL